MKIIITIIGPDAKKALNELMSNIDYDKLRVRISVKKESEWSTKGVSNENRTKTV